MEVEIKELVVNERKPLESAVIPGVGLGCIGAGAGCIGGGLLCMGGGLICGVVC